MRPSDNGNMGGQTKRALAASQGETMAAKDRRLAHEAELRGIGAPSQQTARARALQEEALADRKERLRIAARDGESPTEFAHRKEACDDYWDIRDAVHSTLPIGTRARLGMNIKPTSRE